MKRRGGHTSKVYAAGYFFDSQVMDRDFDDDQIDLIALRERIAAGRAIQLHPDADSRDAGDNPVPLHSHVPDGEREESEFFSTYLRMKAIRRHHAEVKEREKKEQAEEKEREAKREAERKHISEQRQRIHAADTKRRADYLKQFEANPIPRPPWNAWSPEQDMMANLRTGEPLAAGIARVWMNYVMINEGDTNNATLMDGGRPWVERWRGKGLVIYERPHQMRRIVG